MSTKNNQQVNNPTVSTVEKSGKKETPQVDGVEVETPKPAKKSKFADKAVKIFKQYPTNKELHFTIDGTAFFNKIDAQNYASGLSEKKIETVTR